MLVSVGKNKRKRYAEKTLLGVDVPKTADSEFRVI